MSRVTAITRSGYLHHRLPVMAVNHYRDNAITYKAQRDKNARELKLANVRQLLTCRCVSVMLLRLMRLTKELADVKAKMMLCVMMLSLVVVGCTSAVCQSVREATTLPAWIMAASPTSGRHRRNGIISPLRG